ncbi:MAG: ribosome small subunit-dependent GTPase A [Spirochaetia bacterium]|nr:ribosome small subunit-dependent GTPase A [Spirochaetia bacterium]
MGAQASDTFDATVCRIFGAYYDVLVLPEGKETVRARLRGRLRIAGRKVEESWDHIKARHPILVGDRVTCSGLGQEAVIEARLERSNELIRSSQYEQQALGANLDRAILVMSLIFPDISPGFIDRFLASCHSGGVAPLLLFTKPDLLTEEDAREHAAYFISLYADLGYDVHALNLVDPDPESWEILKAIVSNGISLFAGRSGTGKSTLLNRLLGTESHLTGEVSESTGKGRHTTTNSMMVRDPLTGAFYIDTPGVKEWGVYHLDKSDILNSFPEFEAAAEDCKFKDCKHEPGAEGCAIQEKIESGGFQGDRLVSLQSMIDSLGIADRIRKGDYIKTTGRMREGSKYALKNRPPPNRS